MNGCRRLSSRGFERDGLDDLLSDAEQRLHDLSVAREARRSARGYLSPAEARAFLTAARTPRPEDVHASPVLVAYRRTVEAGAGTDAARGRTRDARPAVESGVAADVHAIEAAVLEIALDSSRPRGLLTGEANAPSRHAVIQRLMAYVQHAHRPAHDARTSELAFLTNTLMSGCALQSRPFTAEDASATAVSTCNLGLVHWPERWPSSERERAGDGAIPDDFLARNDLVTAFEVGWSILHEDVTQLVVRRLLATIDALRCTDPGTLLALHALARQVRAHRDTPWLASDALDVIAILDMPAWTSLIGLFGECPVVADALTATVERRRGAIDVGAFDFIATRDQIAVIRAFLARLPELLGG
jgi:hypothetical protein